MNEASEQCARLRESVCGIRLVWSNWDPVIRESGMRDFPQLPFRHVAACAVVRRVSRLAYRKREAAICVRVASQALLSKITDRLRGFNVGVMAAQTTKFFSAC